MNKKLLEKWKNHLLKKDADITKYINIDDDVYVLKLKTLKTVLDENNDIKFISLFTCNERMYNMAGSLNYTFKFDENFFEIFYDKFIDYQNTNYMFQNKTLVLLIDFNYIGTISKTRNNFISLKHLFKFYNLLSSNKEGNYFKFKRFLDDINFGNHRNNIAIYRILNRIKKNPMNLIKKELRDNNFNKEELKKYIEFKIDKILN